MPNSNANKIVNSNMSALMPTIFMIISAITAKFNGYEMAPFYAFLYLGGLTVFLSYEEVKKHESGLRITDYSMYCVVGMVSSVLAGLYLIVEYSTGDFLVTYFTYMQVVAVNLALIANTMCLDKLQVLQESEELVKENFLIEQSI